jgi:hypothetical protein
MLPPVVVFGFEDGLSETTDYTPVHEFLFFRLSFPQAFGGNPECLSA